MFGSDFSHLYHAQKIIGVPTASHTIHTEGTYCVNNASASSPLGLVLCLRAGINLRCFPSFILKDLPSISNPNLHADLLICVKAGILSNSEIHLLSYFSKILTRERRSICKPLCQVSGFLGTLSNMAEE
jgi:hypothetical protein